MNKFEKFVLRTQSTTLYKIAQLLHHQVLFWGRFIKRNELISKILGLYYFEIKSHKSFVDLKEDVRGKNNSISISNGGILHNVNLIIVGNNNKIIIGENCFLQDVSFLIKGDSHKVIFGNNCHIGRLCEFRSEGQETLIKIGDSCTMSEKNQIVAGEKNTAIVLGDDCMLSNHINIRTTDAHPIYNLETGERINAAKDVTIGNHVWMSPDIKIMKGAFINDGCIVGSNTTVNKVVPPNCLIVGYPAKIVKENIKWTRERIV